MIYAQTHGLSPRHVYEELASLSDEAYQATMEFNLIAEFRGWSIRKTSCHCGGRYAWFEEKDGAEICHGCICHRSLKELAN